MPFHKIRQHIRRSGRFIGTENDSAPDPDSHLMIVFFDLLMLNDTSLLKCPLHTRRSQLQGVFVKPRIGYCQSTKYDLIDFSSPEAHGRLTKKFADAVAKCWEGLVLKPLDAPYVDITERNKADKNTRGFGFIGGPNAWIKLKKDYIMGLGDTADFAIVGASAGNERNWSLKRSADTLSKFYAAVLTNKEEVKTHGATPHLEIIFEVTWSIKKSDLDYIQRTRHTRCVEYTVCSSQSSSYHLN